MIATRVEHAEDNRDFIKIYLTEFINVTHPASINKDFRDVQLKLAQGVEQVLRDAVEHGEIQQLDVETIAFTIQDMIRSLTPGGYWVRRRRTEKRTSIFCAISYGKELGVD
jgi:hypothetical protein